MRFTFEIADLFDHLRSLLNEFNDALVKRINSLAACFEPLLGAGIRV